MFILLDLAAPPSSWRSKIVGYVAKEFVLCCLLHTSANVEAGVGGRRCLGEFARLSGVHSLMGS